MTEVRTKIVPFRSSTPTFPNDTFTHQRNPSHLRWHVALAARQAAPRTILLLSNTCIRASAIGPTSRLKAVLPELFSKKSRTDPHSHHHGNSGTLATSDVSRRNDKPRISRPKITDNSMSHSERPSPISLLAT